MNYGCLISYYMSVFSNGAMGTTSINLPRVANDARQVMGRQAQSS